MIELVLTLCIKKVELVKNRLKERFERMELVDFREGMG